MSLAEALPKEITRVRELQSTYKSLSEEHELTQLAPAIAMMEISIRNAIQASADGDAVGMVRAYKDLQEFTE